LASANDNSPVNAAKAQPRSGSGVVAKYSCIRRNLPLRDGVNSNASSSSAKRFTALPRYGCPTAHGRPSRAYRVGVGGVLCVNPEFREDCHDPPSVDCRARPEEGGWGIG
jgi:hypothetical protein